MKPLSPRSTTRVTTFVLRLIPAILISVLALTLAFEESSYEEIAEAFRNAHILPMLLALLSLTVHTLGKAARWAILLRSDDHPPIRNMTVIRTLIIGQMLNFMSPARLGDIARVWIINKHGTSAGFVVGTLVIEKFLDMLAYGILFILVLFLIPLPPWVNQSLFGFALLLLILGVVASFLIIRREWCIARLTALADRLPSNLRSWFVRQGTAALASLAVLRRRPDVLKFLALTCVIWFTAILNNYLVLMALDLHRQVPMITSLLLLVVLQAGLSLPSLPGNVGVFEYACILTLSLFGIPQATALSYGLLLHALILLPTTLLGLIFFWTSGLSFREIQQQQEQPSR